jgi:hypothetical protein
MPVDLFCCPLIEIAADLRAERVTARELIEAAIGRHERFGERLHAYSVRMKSRRKRSSSAAGGILASRGRPGTVLMPAIATRRDNGRGSGPAGCASKGFRPARAIMSVKVPP